MIFLDNESLPHAENKRVRFDDFPLAAKLKVPGLVSGLVQLSEVGTKPGQGKGHPVCAWVGLGWLGLGWVGLGWVGLGWLVG